MKIVTYNLRNGGKKGSGNHWEKIIDALSPDLVLAQETFNPRDYFSADEFPRIAQPPLWNRVSKWGSAILATQHVATSITVPDFEGWVTGGKFTDFSIGGQPRPLSVFSIHTPSGQYEDNVNAILDRIWTIAEGTEILIGGDFNITTAIRHTTEECNNTAKELAILERLRMQFGLINAWQAIHPNTNLEQTLRWTGNKVYPYHCDGIFIPHSWLRHLESCEVVADGWEVMSDHNPIIATFHD